MFYAHFVLSKKGPLAKIWLAAHWDKKLTKAHVFETNIEGSVEAIIQPKAKLALRTSGHLLLGVVRIYSRKAKYLLADCNEAFVKIKMAFRPGMVDLPEENREAALSAITLPEAFHEFDTAMADLSELEVQTQFAVNQSRPEEITMREDLGSITLIGDDGFGDMGFDSGLLDDSQLEETLFSREPTDFATLAMMAMKEKDAENEDGIKNDDEDDVAASHVEEDNYEGPAGIDDDYDSNDGGRFSPTGDGELFADPVGGDGEVGGLFEDMQEDNASITRTMQAEQAQPAPFLSPTRDPSEQLQPLPDIQPPFSSEPPMPQLDMEVPIYGQSSLDQPSQNESETFTLKPIDVLVTGPERKYRKKRKLIVDEQKAIASETMKLQLSDTSDIVTTLDLAPPTKKLMHWKETGGVDKLTIMPGRPLVSKKLFKLFSSGLVAKQAHEKASESIAEKKDNEAQQEEKRSEEMEVRNTVGADGMPRLVFAVKKHLISSTPTHEPVEQSSFKVPPSPSLHEPLKNNNNTINNSTFSAGLDNSRTTNEENQSHNVSLDVSSDIQAPPTPLQTSAEVTNEHITTYNNDDDDDACAYNYDSYDNADDRTDMEIDPTDQNVEEDEDKREEDEDAVEDQNGLDSEELTEEAEETRWNKKSQLMMHTFNRLLNKKDQVSLKDILSKFNRKQVASKFYSLLVLKKTQMVNVHQDRPYSDIIITRGSQFAPM